ncbi:(2Fe-2S) ferredoxin domain-containing protein [Leptolyngbya boryana CZ1]|uniref:(2Fe-2S) ferredoxin domain-containing protein n=1 Tax=Leptolyngbya boryana CZ1 TaxID=3060204 RepID=A0AA97APN3_LEPBY|nr:(2Fe-2S) ferredoxin domain-containing protein [Leptolyngbya boryana]WNZ46898.1 (2Fe-2S) ferredoxin domain-containing protein [Leptolyngbya boryana CZ1]
MLIEDAQSREFCLDGQFLAFVVESGKLKYLRMSSANEEIQIKLSKQVRAALFRSIEHSSPLRPLDPIQVTGKQSIDPKSGSVKLTAQQILRSHPTSEKLIEFKSEKSCPDKPCSDKPCYRVLVCQNSKCQRKGGRKQHRELETAIRDRELHTVATIERSDCLGKCSMAPNIMLMPGKKRLSGMEPNAIADLLKTLSSR